MLRKIFVLSLTHVMMMGAHAQVLRGTVVESDTGEPLTGATLRVGNTTTGTMTDIDGQFEFSELPTGEDKLRVSYIGMSSRELSLSELLKAYEDGQPIVITLDYDQNALGEVVVTALGISREKKALGYAAVDVKGDELTAVRGADGNPISALQGKVAGLQISGNSTAMGGSSKVLIRGVNSISGNNQPLFVIDGVPLESRDFNSEDTARGAGGYDYGNVLADINPDDIESMSVLKGASASALYGSRANNGVVLITTKKGRKSDGLGIAFNSSVGFERLSKLPRFQNEYGGGGSTQFSHVTINGKEYNVPAYAIDESWGPRLEGQDVLTWYDLYKWEMGGKQGNPTTSKWLPTDSDIRDFYRTGVTLTNNISFSQATDKATLRISYTNNTVQGIAPNSEAGKHVFNAAGSVRTLGDRLEVFTNVSYVNNRAKGRSSTGYSDANCLQGYCQWWQRNVSFKQLEELYILPDGTMGTWNRTSVDNPESAFNASNPFWVAYMDYENDSRNHLYGNVGLRLQILSWLAFQYKTNLDFFVDKQYERIAVGTKRLSSYSELSRQQYELNHEFLLTASRQAGDFNLSGMVGGNLMYRHFEQLSGHTNGGLAIPLFYNLANSIDTPSSYNTMNEKAINSVFADFSAGWRSMLYLGATLRADHSSTLPKGNNTYYYPSVNGSFIFSELLGNRISWLSFGKLRLGWAMVGNDTDPYSINNTYRQYTNIGNGVPGYVTQIQLNNPNLKPESTKSWEAGLEMHFLRNRLGLDLTYYQSRTHDLIVPFSVSASTGYVYAVTNAGSIQNRGIELSLTATPVRTDDFEWNTTFSMASNRNKVVSLINGVEYYRLASGRFMSEVGAFVGREYGMIMGYDYVYDRDGNRMIDPETGLYRVTNELMPVGSAYPDITGGWTNSFRYRGFDLGFVFSFQHGGVYHSMSYLYGLASGQLEETVADNVREEGLVLPGVIDEDGTPNTKRISAHEYYSAMDAGPIREGILSSDFIRLREVSLGYTFRFKPSSSVKSLRLSAYGKNLGLWGPDVKHYDPEVAITNSGNVQGLECGATPTTSSYGFSVSLKF